MNLYQNVLNEDGSFNREGIDNLIIHYEQNKGYSLENAIREAMSYATERRALRFPHLYKGKWTEVKDPIDTVGTRD